MKNLLLLLTLLLTFSCTKDIVPAEIEIQALFPEQYDLSLLGLFGTWELLNTGPLSCQGDYYTFKEDRTLDIDYSFDCNEIVIISYGDKSTWTGDENSITLSTGDFFLSYSETYTILAKSENTMQTSQKRGEILLYQNWKKI